MSRLIFAVIGLLLMLAAVVVAFRVDVRRTDEESARTRVEHGFGDADDTTWIEYLRATAGPADDEWGQS